MPTIDSNTADLKRLVQEEWASDETAAAWRKHYSHMKEHLGAVTAALVDAAAPAPGMLVLDLASGSGQPALTIAPKLQPAGKVIATDLSEPMLAVLRSFAAQEGVANVETRFADAHELPFADNTFDLVTSRFGAMFFVEIGKTLGEIRRVLKPGGRITFAVWGEPKPGTYFGAAALPFIKRLDKKPDPDGPGPMRYAESGKLMHLVVEAGYRNTSEVMHDLPAPYRGSPEDFLAAMLEIAAPFRNAVKTMSGPARSEAKEEALRNLGQLYDGTYTRVTAPILIITGEK